MNDKLKAILDSKATWIGASVFASAIFGDKAKIIVDAIGSAVMAFL